MSLIQSIILGIIQGLTEFLPISSTAHLRIVPALFHWEDPGTAFSAIIQLGTMLSVVIYFWKDLYRIYSAFVRSIFLYFKNNAKSNLFNSYDSKLALWIILGTIPICIFGLLFKDPLEKGMVRDLNIISFYLIFFGLLLFISELVGKQNKTLEKINALDVMLMGLAQSFALIPGVSRSGVTLFAGLLLGFKRAHAAKFSFLLSVPAVLASGVLEFLSLISLIQSNVTQILWANIIAGLITAFISGYLAIDFLLKYLQTQKTHVFVVYRIFLGCLIIFLSYRGLIH